VKRLNCIFCGSPATDKRGEHVFDDWLNRIDGRRVKDLYTFELSGKDGRLIRTYQERGINTTRPVVCDPCNHEWMSALTNNSKKIVEGLIRHECATILSPEDIATISAWLFMKAAVVAADNSTRRFFSPSRCGLFAENRTLPDGLQVWLAAFRGRHKMAARAWSDTIGIKSGGLKGYELYLFTYVVGHLACQLTYPRWTKVNPRRPPLPVIEQAPDWTGVAIPVWPETTAVQWPPWRPLDDKTLDAFRYRFTENMQGPRSLDRTQALRYKL
jgi:hypothetical protein